MTVIVCTRYVLYICDGPTGLADIRSIGLSSVEIIRSTPGNPYSIGFKVHGARRYPKPLELGTKRQPFRLSSKRGFPTSEAFVQSVLHSGLQW